MSKIVFISTNEIWSGSEELWYSVVLKLLQKKISIVVVTKYRHPNLEKLAKQGVRYYNMQKRFAELKSYQRVLNKFKLSHSPKDLWRSLLQELSPNFAIVSQGNNLQATDWLELLNSNKIPYCTITQLVAEVHWLNLDIDLFNKLRNLYSLSHHNYFVSLANKRIHEQMFCLFNAPNNSVLNNPSLVPDIIPTYPQFGDTYRIAFVGRFECFHKGLDILLEVINLPKWRERNLIFNFYGNGPHKEIIVGIKKHLHLDKLIINEFSSDIGEIWKNNQLLILPSRMEGQSLALLESMRYNRAAIVTAVGGAEDLIEEGVSGFLAASATIKAIDNALEKAWGHRSEWMQLGINAGNKIRNVFTEDPIDYLVAKLQSDFYHRQ